jgi:Fe-S oxidoreductase
MWEKKKKKILKSEASLVATDCPGCLFQLRANLGEASHLPKIYHTAELYAKTIGKISREQN